MADPYADDGEAAFHRLRVTAATFDRRLRSGISEEELDDLRGILDRLTGNVGRP